MNASQSVEFSEWFPDVSSEPWFEPDGEQQPKAHHDDSFLWDDISRPLMDDLQLEVYEGGPTTESSDVSPRHRDGSFACPIYQEEIRLNQSGTCNGLSAQTMSDVRRHDSIDQTEFETSHGTLCSTEPQKGRRGRAADKQWTSLYTKLSTGPEANSTAEIPDNFLLPSPKSIATVSSMGPQDAHHTVYFPSQSTRTRPQEVLLASDLSTTRAAIMKEYLTNIARASDSDPLGMVLSRITTTVDLQVIRQITPRLVKMTRVSKDHIHSYLAACPKVLSFGMPQMEEGTRFQEIARMIWKTMKVSQCQSKKDYPMLITRCHVHIGAEPS
ncbi:hypothetical protein BKA66DRAFT_569958 [Pyrenochaeta sp. MPI-SDFR-AT-0127]|nr:hypothetical protein BKA66DRAFT_569958 [Pyrenochaeta sp. MPI-SDFR-AT-0127]